MKKLTLALLGLMFFCFHLRAEKFTFTYTFDTPQVVSEGEYSKIVYPNCHNFGAEGMPSMPFYAAELLIEQGQKLVNVRIVASEYYSEAKQIKVAPAQRQFPLSQKSETPYQVIPNDAVYTSSQPYPEKVVDNFKTQYLSGHAIAAFTVCPVIYIPANNEVQFLKSITLEIETQNSPDFNESKRFLRNSRSVNERLKKIIDNPERLKSYSYPEKLTTDEVDMLIITESTLQSGFQDFIDYKEATGFIVETILTSEIYSQYTGQDEAEKVRNCIIDYYQNKNLEYVVLGGDADGQSVASHMVPHRGMSVSAYGEPDNNIPADIYYSGLDGTWNTDNDGNWGEDGEEDVLAEVFVGRISTDNATELENFLNKVIMYQNEPVVEDIEKALMLGELLWNDPTWGGDYKDEIADGSSSCGYTTAPISSNVTVQRLYERDGGWEITEVFDIFSNSGLNLLNHLGHCDVTYSMKMNNSHVTTTNFSNNGVTRGFVIGYSQGCYCGSFDNRGSYGSFGSEDCFAEAITGLETGMVATIMNSRYGWGQHSSTDGASQYFDRQFFDAIFGENISIIGQANASSKEDNISYLNSHEGAIRWCCYETNLFGDPSMDIWTASPSDLVASYTTGVSVGTSQINFQTDAPYARVALLQDGQLIGRAVADINGDALVETFEPITNPITIDVSIIGHNKNRHTGNIYVFSDVPYVVYNSLIINDPLGNNNHQADYGESISLDIELKNVGTQPANGVTTTLSTDDVYVSITDNSESFGDFDAEEAILINNAFAFSIVDSVPDNHPVRFKVEATDGDSIWISYFTVKVNAPVLSIGEMTVSNDDNGNGRVDPGEDAQLIYYLQNTGGAAANNPLIELSGDCAYFTIINNIQNLDAIAAESVDSVVFNVSAHDAAINGTLVNLTAMLSEIESISKSDMIVIGQSPEIVIGTGTEDASYYPFYTYYENNKSHALYRGSEFGGGTMLIQKIAFNFTAIGGEPSLNNLTISMKQTVMNELGSSYPDMSGATTVFSEAVYTMPTQNGWHEFDIEDFSLNTTDSNLIVEVVWGDNGQWSDSYTVEATNCGYTSVTYGYADSETPPVYDGNSMVRPNMTFFFAGEQSDTLYTVTFTVLDSALNTPLPEAIVKVGSLEQLVDANGEVNFTLIPANYVYSAECPLHAVQSNPFVVDNDIEITILMKNNEGVAEYKAGDLKLYPNPANQYITIESPYIISNVLLYSLDGKLVHIEKTNSNVCNFPLDKAVTGMYILQVASDKTIKTHKIQIVK